MNSVEYFSLLQLLNSLHPLGFEFIYSALLGHVEPLLIVCPEHLAGFERSDRQLMKKC